MNLPVLDHDQISGRLASGKTLVVKFSAPWCGPCKAFGPIVEGVARNHPELEFVEVDLDASPGLAAQWRVRAVPTIIGFKQGKLAFQATGLVPAGVLEQHLQALA